MATLQFWRKLFRLVEDRLPKCKYWQPDKKTKCAKFEKWAKQVQDFLTKRQDVILIGGKYFERCIKGTGRTRFLNLQCEWFRFP